MWLGSRSAKLRAYLVERWKTKTIRSWITKTTSEERIRSKFVRIRIEIIKNIKGSINQSQNFKEKDETKSSNQCWLKNSNCKIIKRNSQSNNFEEI